MPPQPGPVAGAFAWPSYRPWRSRGAVSAVLGPAGLRQADRTRGTAEMHPAAVERDFHAQSNRLLGFGWILLVLAVLAWGWAAWQVFVPHGVDRSSKTCAPPAFADRPDPYSNRSVLNGDERHERNCAAVRDWTTPVALLVFSAPAFAAAPACSPPAGSWSAPAASPSSWSRPPADGAPPARAPPVQAAPRSLVRGASAWRRWVTEMPGREGRVTLVTSIDPWGPGRSSSGPRARSSSRTAQRPGSDRGQ